MKTLYVKGIEESVLLKLDELAAQKGMSRSEYVREQLSHLTAFPEIIEIENKYETLVNNFGQIISEQTAAIKELREAILKGEK